MKFFIIKYAGLLLLSWFLLILLLCALPAKYVPSASWLDLLSFDKWVHAGMFFLLGFLSTIFGLRSGLKLYGVTVLHLLWVIYGGLLEIMQGLLFSERSSDWKDFVANSAGVWIAWFFYARIRRKWFRQSAEPAE